MSLFWKVTVWLNLIWLIIGFLILLGNGSFGWIHFVYATIGIGTVIKCLELAKELEIKQRQIDLLKSKQ